jgi:hypothetical protein
MYFANPISLDTCTLTITTWMLPAQSVIEIDSGHVWLASVLM